MESTEVEIERALSQLRGAMTQFRNTPHVWAPEEVRLLSASISIVHDALRLLQRGELESSKKLAETNSAVRFLLNQLTASQKAQWSEQRVREFQLAMEANSTEVLSAVLEQESTLAATSTSSQPHGPSSNPSGPAAPSFSCVHPMIMPEGSNNSRPIMSITATHGSRGKCQDCGALLRLAWTPVPGAGEQESQQTYQKQGSQSSAMDGLGEVMREAFHRIQTLEERVISLESESAPLRPDQFENTKPLRDPRHTEPREDMRT